MDAAAPQVSAGGLQQPPVPASVVGDVGLHLVVCLFVGEEHSFNPSDLGCKKTVERGSGCHMTEGKSTFPDLHYFITLS